jgi:hypothetical protein
MSIDIHPPGLKKIIAEMTAKLDRAEGVGDSTGIALIARVIACAANQLTLVGAPDVEILRSAEKLLEAQAALMRHEGT